MTLSNLSKMSPDAARLTIAAMDTAEVEALREDAHQAEMTGWCDGSGAAPVSEPHRVWLWCGMELDRRGTGASVKGAGRTMDELGKVP